MAAKKSSQSCLRGISLNCRAIRIGSYEYTPTKKVYISTKGIKIVAPSVKNESRDVAFQIQMTDIVKVLVHFGQELPVIFLYTMSQCGAYIRKALDMTHESGPYFNPTSEITSPFKKITLLFEIITKEAKMTLKALFAGKLMDELNCREANEILVRARSKQINNVTKTASTSTSASVSSGATSRSPAEVRQILIIYPPGRGGIPVTRRDYKRLARGRYLNDVIIDFYLKYLVHDVLTERQREKTHIFSTFFYERLTTININKNSNPHVCDSSSTAAQSRHSAVKTWTKKVNIFEKDFIVVPINENSHWFVAIICYPGLDGCRSMIDDRIVTPQEIKKRERRLSIRIGNGIVTSLNKQERRVLNGDPDSLNERAKANAKESDLDIQCDSEEEENESAPIKEVRISIRRKTEPIKQPCILIFDSSAGESPSTVIETLRDYLTCEYQAKMVAPNKVFNEDNMKGSCPKIPQQNNFTDCGLYLLQYVEQFFKDPIKDYSLPIKQLTNWFDEITVTRKREEISNLLKLLMHEHNPKSHLALPRIKLPTLNGKLIKNKDQNKEESDGDEGSSMATGGLGSSLSENYDESSSSPTSPCSGSSAHSIDKTSPCSGSSVHSIDKTSPCSGSSAHSIDKTSPCSGSSAHSIDKTSPCSGSSAHSIDKTSPCSGSSAHSIDKTPPCSGSSAHSIDKTSPCSGSSAHSIDKTSPCSGSSAHSIDQTSPCSGSSAHSIDKTSPCSGSSAHSIDRTSPCSGSSAHSIDKTSPCSGSSAHSIDKTSPCSGSSAHSIDKTSPCSGSSAHSIDKTSPCSGSSAHSINKTSPCSGSSAHSIDKTSPCFGSSAHSIDKTSQCSGSSAHSIDKTSPCSGSSAHSIDKTSPCSGSSVHSIDKTSPCSGSSVHAIDKTSPCSGSSVHSIDKISPCRGSSAHSIDKTDDHDTFNLNPIEPDMRLEGERLKTFSAWPIACLTPETLAQNGFYYLECSYEVCCAFCKMKIMIWLEGDDPIKDHQPQCPIVCTLSATSDGELGMPGPVHKQYASEAARLESFKNWSRCMPRTEDLAEAGFFYTGQDDKTCCFYCGGKIKVWKTNDVPWKQHARWFDRCAYVLLVKGQKYIQQVKSEACIESSEPKPYSLLEYEVATGGPGSSLSTNYDESSLLPTSPYSRSSAHSIDKTDDHDTFNLNPIEPDMHLEGERLKTFSAWPITFLTPKHLAQNGFYYLECSDEVRCAFCKVKIVIWMESDDPIKEHQTQCPFVRTLSATSDGELGMPGPVHKQYASEAARLESFKNWSRCMPRTKELAEAGFFYTGQDDKTCCFYCGGKIKVWKTNDVPWEQHARWFDRCAYVLLVKGQKYIQQVKSETCIESSEPKKPKQPTQS